MAEDSAAQRHLPATPKRIERARKEGSLPRSRDLPHFTALVGAGALMAMAMPRVWDELLRLFAWGLRFDAPLLHRPGVMTERLWELSLPGLVMSVGLGGVIVLAAVLGHLGSGGWNWTWKPLAPKLSHLDPLQGFARLFQWQQFGQALKAAALAVVLGGVGAWVLNERMAGMIGLLNVPLPRAIAWAATQLLSALMGVALVLALFAALDVPLQQQLYRRRLRMSREEVKQEVKESEGNLELKHRMRARMREITKRRMMAAIPKADLVVMNPTHYAVALRYDEASMGAPVVVAKGADVLAFRIREVAQEHRVPVLQSPMLARALYAHAKLDQEIPAALFAAVAQVLAYVYQLKAAKAGRGPTPGPAPDPQVPLELDPHHQAVRGVDDELLEEDDA